MLRHLILFEIQFYTRKIAFYGLLLAFLAFGILVGTSAGIAFPNITKNSPYAINFILGLFSLVSLFPIIVVAAQSLLREKDAGFEQILYATPLKVRDYFVSRFLLVFGMATLCFSLFLMGYAVGHLMKMAENDAWGAFRLSYYLHSFSVIVLPNIFLCTVLVCCAAWFSKRKMGIYLSGLGIYVLYMVVSIFSNSPLIAGASPASAGAMSWAAKLDPFGMAAFFEQTHHWSASTRNTTVLQLSGNLLINRIAVVLLASTLLFFAYKSFTFNILGDRKKQKTPSESSNTEGSIYRRTATQTEGKRYAFLTVLSFLTIDLKSIVKSVSFVVLIILSLFALGMEIYGAIDGGIRLPQNYVTTTLMCNTILATLPVLLLFSTLFYGSELVWKSQSVHFDALENTTRYAPRLLFLSKFLTLLCLVFVLIACSILMGIGFQQAYQYPLIDWATYLSLFYFLGLPTAICALLILALHYLMGKKYTALSVSALFLLLTNASLGKAFGFSHSLLRFANFLPDKISEMNGFGYLPHAFFIKMAYSFFFAFLMVMLALFFQNKPFFKSIASLKLTPIFAFLGPLSIMAFLGLNLAKNSPNVSKIARIDAQQSYEEAYKIYKNRAKPSVTTIKTSIDLFPEQNYYTVKGSYILVNKTADTIAEILLNTSKDLTWNAIESKQLDLIKKDDTFGQYLFKIRKPMLPNDSIVLDFGFEYRLNPLQGHQSFNAIVENGTFMRISNFFPHIGYDADDEIEDKEERKKRNMSEKEALTKVDARLKTPYNYEFIDFDALISTSAEQTAVSVGHLDSTFTKNNRRYCHYVARAIPFRFAVSSAKYAVEKSNYAGIGIEILYHSQHHQNIQHLMTRIKQSLAYCETNFGAYPYKSIRFAEISRFTEGFAATAYPASIFINERHLHINLNADKQQDIINELAGHELSHQWWGNAQLQPDYREGSGLLTETLAQYTELMLYKLAHGAAKMQDLVNLHRELYDSEKAFSGEAALYNADPNNANVIYNKGLVKMHELYVLIGEKRINSALKNLLAQHRYPLPPATSLDVMAALKAVVERDKHEAIEDIFKK